MIEENLKFIEVCNNLPHDYYLVYSIRINKPSSIWDSEDKKKVSSKKDLFKLDLEDFTHGIYKTLGILRPIDRSVEIDSIDQFFRLFRKLQTQYFSNIRGFAYNPRIVLDGREFTSDQIREEPFGRMANELDNVISQNYQKCIRTLNYIEIDQESLYNIINNINLGEYLISDSEDIRLLAKNMSKD